MNEWLAFLWAPYQTYSRIEISVEALAAVFGVVSVLLAQRRHIWVYPVGLVSTILYSYLFFKWGLYGEALINAYYTAMSVYGWILWRQHSEQDHVHVAVQWANFKDAGIGGVIWLCSFLFVLAIYYFRPWIESGFSVWDMNQHSIHHLGGIDFLDASIAATCFVAMWLQAQRRINHWYLWTIANVVMVPLMFYKGYGITALQYMVFVVLAWIGLRLWKQSLQAS
ncbi:MULTISPECIES: nicotinamide riboside transporter PnuC [Vitreoscilla]|uniref:Nicotinamide riboside transporter PnuC n=1 Tax=Vitreoscilla stercoraria TaxID=61 RepID=A0ABY4EFN2_VITST|nr:MULTISPECIES: nicotinamide riboside transporter PnuC [Vitreoscilla]AUZ03871.1 nicotinamide mononucleotide transporter PnuC [Vitreoscilla sp. C1]UOO92202.1 nicotinamide riboside transporter PnuC [Vitreoscilla stercoraria]